MLHPLLAASGVPDDPGADEPSSPRSVGHFAGMMLDPAKVDVAALPFRLPSPAPESMLTSLEAVEAVLSERAAKLGVEVRRGVEHLQAVLRRVSGTDVALSDVHLASSFTDRAMQATTYRQGRVLLAGDAAHIHPPFDGQGLNLGIGDAMNLGWKLAATVHGDVPDGLLDTYTGERHPIGAWVLDWTRAQAAVMRPDPHAQAIQAVIRDLLGTRDGTTYVFEKVSGSSLRYDLGSEQPLVGRNAPDLHLENGTRLGDLMRDGRGVALDFSTDRRLRDSATGWESRIRYAAGPARNDLGFGAVLIRPDGIVAWAGDRTPDREAFERAAGHWFGTPA
ncbi:FAD-dependent monooxygenase [Nonomuraea aurantiaca]|uniref:FAD-dependent monooxygenase n=1 Tax=Nonomuraea aurantiaca TaxID=2878562 RepID=UPI0027E1CA03|nr:FAD-dependent monooxygenase [Nonomuraea aurantiaca]